MLHDILEFYRLSYSDIAAQPSTWVIAWVKVPDKIVFGAPAPAGLDLELVSIIPDSPP